MTTASFRTFLFVPATRPDRVPKAFASGADDVIIDLEDAVEMTQKSAVRASLLAFDDDAEHDYWLRINAAHTTDYAHDVELTQNLRHVKGIFLPKTESALSITALHQATKLPIIAVIETAKGVLNIGEIAQAKGLFAMTYGCLDLTKSLGMAFGTSASSVLLDRIRTDLLLHSTINGLAAPIETIFADFADEEGVADFAKYAQDFGFGGQLLIHPKQVAPIKQATLPNAKMIEFAQAVLKAHQETGQAVFSVAGRMVDLPVIEWAKKLLGQ